MSMLSRRVLRLPWPSRPPNLVPLPLLRRYLQPQGWVTAMKKLRFDFPAAVTDELHRLGAREGGTYGLQYDTAAGLLEIHPYDDWIACRFDDVERAKAQVSSGYLNRYSGKWNWNFVAPTLQDVDFFINEVERLLPTPPATA